MKIFKLLIFIFTITSFTSCVTQQACSRKYPPKIINKDSIAIRDSIITVYLHDSILINADTAQDNTIVHTANGIINSNKLIKELHLCKATSQVINGKLNLTLMQKQAIVDSLLKHNIKVKNKIVYKTRTRVVVKYIHHWYSGIEEFLAIFMLGIILFILARTAFKIISKIP